MLIHFLDTDFVLFPRQSCSFTSFIQILFFFQDSHAHSLPSYRFCSFSKTVMLIHFLDTDFVLFPRQSCSFTLIIIQSSFFFNSPDYDSLDLTQAILFTREKHQELVMISNDILCFHLLRMQVLVLSILACFLSTLSEF